MLSEDTQHLTPQQVARILNVNVTTVMRRLGDYPGVIDLARPPLRGKRRHRLLRIPRGVLNRFLYDHKIS
jgi:hypothetical protein